MALASVGVRRIESVRGAIATLGLAAAVLGLCACGQVTPAAKGRLAVKSTAYDCDTRSLTVTGAASPAIEGQDVQLQVRSDQFPKAPVWRVVETDAAGSFVATGKFAVASREATSVRVKLASVAGGVRVFSAVTVHEVYCAS